MMKCKGLMSMKLMGHAGVEVAAALAVAAVLKCGY